jgi:hypothetical protein
MGSHDEDSGGLKMEQAQGSIKVNRIIGYIRQQEFPFDTHDDPKEILSHYGIAIEMKAEDKPFITEELRKMAEQEQTIEITRAVMKEQGLTDEWRRDDDN